MTMLVVVHDPVWKYYADNLRGPMFTGFLTVSSFLLTMTTFVVMNLSPTITTQNTIRSDSIAVGLWAQSIPIIGLSRILVA